MLYDADTVDESNIPIYDVCIIGSGPAGLTLANELVPKGLKLCVLESGITRKSAVADSLRALDSEGIRIKVHSRERILGGSSTTWSGLSSYLGEEDLAARSWIPYSGWPISYETLRGLYARTSAYDFPSPEAFGEGGFRRLREKSTLSPRWEKIQEKVFLAKNRPQRFGERFRHLFEQERADLYTGLSAASLQAEPGTRHIASCTAHTQSGRAISVRAKIFILAAGGIENPRILLNSRDMYEQGLGNESDQVGRYFMNHPKGNAGVVWFKKPVAELPYYFGCLFKGFAGYAGMELAPAFREEHGLVAAYARLEPRYPWSDNIGVQSLIALIRSSSRVLQWSTALLSRRVASLRDYAETGETDDSLHLTTGPWMYVVCIARVLLHPIAVAQYLWYRLVPGATPHTRAARLRNFAEMAPDPENRVTLSKKRDCFGVPLPHVHHDMGKQDRESLKALHHVLRDEVQRLGIGELTNGLEADTTWNINEDASHHMGTTRMGKDPQTSVVDADCRIHGVDNVYVAGSSVFPTSGVVNPTMTIVALSIKLADHLKARSWTEAVHDVSLGAAAPGETSTP